MSNLKKLRLSLGLTQQDLADYLSVSRAYISMAESSRRALSTAAEVKLSAMQRHLALRSSFHIVAELQKQSEQAKNMLRKQVQECNQLATGAARRLKVMRSRHEQCQKILAMTSGLLDELPAGTAGKRDRLWLEALKATTIKKMKACNPGKQALLELQIEVFFYHAQQAGAKKV